LQRSPGQQGCPGPPQATQYELEPACVSHVCQGSQLGVIELVPRSQQSSSVPPQATQLASPLGRSQTVPEAVQRLLEQQAFPKAPHEPHRPCEQVPATVLPQAEPDATQADGPPTSDSTQQPPSGQKCPGQHGSLGAPQCEQTSEALACLQKVFGAVQVEPAQHAMEAPPQVAQAPLLHVPPPT
jgi:hypothetical protein